MNTAGMIEVEEIRQLLSHLYGEITVLDNNVQSVRSILRKLTSRAAQKNPDEARAIERFVAASRIGQKSIETLEQLWEKVAREYERLIGTSENDSIIDPLIKDPNDKPAPVPGHMDQLLNAFFAPPSLKAKVA